jgi:hypothetical protein
MARVPNMRTAAAAGRPQIPPIVYTSEERCWTAIGTREQLIGAGLATPAHIPTGLKRLAHDRDQHGRWWCARRLRGGRWSFSVHRTADEVATYKRAHLDRERVAAMAKTPTEWRAKQLQRFHAMAALLYDTLETRCGYALSDSAMASIDALFTRIELVVANGEVMLDAAKREAYVRSLSDVHDAMPSLRVPLRLVASTA